MSSRAGYGYSYQQQPNQASKTQMQYGSQQQQPVPSPYSQQPVPSPYSQQPVPSPYSQQPMPSPYQPQPMPSPYQPQPAPAPYQAMNNRGGDICNPCCCCKGSCNLRLNCIVIAIIFIVMGVLSCILFSIYPENIEGCDHILKNPEIYKLYYTDQLQLCKDDDYLRTGWVVTGAIGIILYVVGGILLFVSIFARNAVCAFLAGGIVLVAAVLIFVESLFLAGHLSDLRFISLYSKGIRKEARSSTKNEWKIRIYLSFMAVTIIAGLNMIYPVICCIQFGRQIRAGVDLDLVVGPQPMGPNNAFPLPPSYGPPPAYGSPSQTSPSAANYSASAQRLPPQA